MKADETELRARIVAEAYSWVGTPYVHCADIKGAGADCAMLLVRVFSAVGIVPADFDPRPYAPHWFLHRNEELYLGGLERYAHKVSEGRPGDIAAYRFGRTASHGAIIVSDDLMIHAYQQQHRVCLQERRALDHRLDSYWSCFPAEAS